MEGSNCNYIFDAIDCWFNICECSMSSERKLLGHLKTFINVLLEELVKSLHVDKYSFVWESTISSTLDVFLLVSQMKYKLGQMISHCIFPSRRWLDGPTIMR